MSIFVKTKALEIMQMRPLFIAVVLCLVAISCSKEQSESPKQDQTVPASEFEALKKEVEDLKAALAAITSENIEVLKQENEALKAQVESLTSGFFEVDGLRFDKNGTLISVPILEREVVKDVGGGVSLTVTRSYDGEGRVIEIMNKYSGMSYNYSYGPYYWQKVIYEYSGKKCKTTTQTSKYGLPAGTPYEEEIVETTYW